MTACMVAAALLFGGMGWMGQKSTAFAAESTPTMRDIRVSVEAGNLQEDVLSQTPARFGGILKSYLQENEDGTISHITQNSDGAVTIDTYSSSYEYLNCVTLDPECSLWGGYYCGKDYNFCLYGESNIAESEDAEVLRVVKYSKDWKRLDAASFYGMNTRIPFASGTPRMCEKNGVLYLHMSHQMFRSSDGLNHQANLQLHLDIDSMTEIYSLYNVSNVGQHGYVSHSFDQYIQSDGEYVYTADLGDAYPRSVVVCKKKTDGSMVSHLDVLPIAGTVGNNTTGVTLGGFALSSDQGVLIGNSMQQDGSGSNSNVRNIFVGFVNPDLSDATLYWLTDYDTANCVSQPKLLQIDDHTFIGMWNECEETAADTMMHAVKFTDDGTILEDVTVGAVVSRCDPILVNGEMVWEVCNGNDITFYHMEVQNLSQYNGVQDAPLISGTYGDLTYVRDDVHAVITGCDQNAESVVIPDEIDGVPVTEIAATAFFYCYWLEDLTLPAGLTAIGAKAFYYCNSLQTITIPKTVKRIDAEAFSKCNALQEVFLPYAVVRIRSNAFEECQNLETVVVSNPSCQIEGDAATFPEEAALYGYPDSTLQTYAGTQVRTYYQMGDLNQDDQVTVADLIWLQRYLLGDQTLDAVQCRQADFQNDHVENGFDLSILYRWLLQV